MTDVFALVETHNFFLSIGCKAFSDLSSHNTMHVLSPYQSQPLHNM
jgi:hypothetical protein